jgi:hypothetical protein
LSVVGAKTLPFLYLFFTKIRFCGGKGFEPRSASRTGNQTEENRELTRINANRKRRPSAGAPYSQ